MNASYRILVADDNNINQTVIKGMLNHAGYQVDAVQNGEEAIQALESHCYDLVIMDCLMPVLDGFAAARRIRNGDSTRFDPRIPILATTALSTEKDRQKCLDAGMTAFITKPIDAESLFAAVKGCLEEGVDPKNPKRPLTDGRTVKPAFEKFNDSQSLLLNSISHLFLADARLWQKQLKSLAKALKIDELGQLAHKIRGTADIFSEHRLSDLAEQLERSCKLDKDDPSLALASLLAEELNCLERKYQSAN